MNNNNIKKTKKQVSGLKEKRIDLTKKKHPALKVIGIVVLVLMIAMIAFRLLALVAPDLMDSILYTEEELRMLGK